MFAITYLTQLFHSEAIICSFFLPMFTLHVGSLVHSLFDLSQALQLYATYPIIYHGCLSQFIDVNG